jgi:hypothetical protein
VAPRTDRQKIEVVTGTAAMEHREANVAIEFERPVSRLGHKKTSCHFLNITRNQRVGASDAILETWR